MKNEQILSILISALPAATVTRPDSGSIYLSFAGCKVKQIRIAGHAGHKAKKGHWELRTDAATSRKGLGRIYSAGSINQLIKEFK